MEEDNKVWLGLGEDLIDLSLFLTNAANNILSYVQSKPWSSKRKQSFLNAYNAIMQSGVTGATNDTGLWLLTTQSQLDPTGLSDRDQEMLGDAAYFILSQMQSVTPRGTTTEESNKEKTKFVGATAFDNWVSNNYFGGNTFSRPEDWNVLDERDITTGKRGVAKRLAKMKDYLTEYRNSLNDDDWDYSESPIGKNTAEVQAKIDRAINALNGKTEIDLDIIDSLNAIGIRYRDWFDNGLGENSGHTDSAGNPLTWQQWQKQQAADAETKAKENAAKVKALNEALRANPWSKALVHKYTNPVWNEREFANLLGDRDLVSVLNEYASNISSLNSGQRKFVHSAYRSKIPKVQISDEEYNILKRIPGFKNASKSRFSKIAGVDGLIYDNSTKTLLSPASVEGQVSSEDPNLWIHNLSDSALEDKTKNMSAEKRKKYLASHKDGLTSAEWEELASIGFDIASIVDPEMISSAGLALTGSGLRHHAAASQPGGMSTSDKWWQAADYGLSILGSIPVLGDAALGARAINNLKKAIVPLGVVMAGANVPQVAKAAYNKVIKGEDLTIQDWRAIGAVLTAAVGYGRGRLMSKRAEALRRTGGGTSKTIKEGSVKTDKGEIKGLSEKTTKELQLSFKKAGNNNEAKTKALRDHPEVQAKAKEQGIKLEEASINTESSLRNRGPKVLRETPEITTTSRSEGVSGGRGATLRAMTEFNKNHGWLARKGLAEQDWIFRKTGGYESAPQSSNWFKDTWNKLRHSDWDEFGTNKLNTSTNNPTIEASKSPEQPKVTSAESKSKRQRYRNELVTKQYNDVIENGNFSKNEIKTNKTRKIGDSTISIEKNADGSYTVSEIKSDLSRTDLLANNDKQVKETIARIIKEHRNTMKSSIKSGGKSWKIEEISKTLRELKRAGWLKQGGQINNFDLDTTISNFLKNLK